MPLDVTDVKTLFGSWPKLRLDVSPDALVADLRRHGIARALTLSTAAALYDERSGNQETLQECRSRPELIPVATLHPYNYLASEGAIPALREQGFRVFRFLNRLEGYSLDLYCVAAMMRDLARAGLPCIADAVSLDDPHRLARLSHDTGATIICTGLGYTFEAEVIALARDYPRLYFDAGRLTGPDGIELFCRHVGAHRLVYGSDYPFDDVLPSLLLLQQAEIAESDRRRIACDNAMELLGL
ncbi:MAG: amidohydrolase family protein [Anaerolineae bacterium]|nr:amidohydrolase family protein [Anaerolineae bacterium]